MSQLQVIFVAKNKKDDESITVRRNGSTFQVKFSSETTIDTTTNFQTSEDVRQYILNVLTLVVHDNDPCIGIQFFFPGSPSVLYKHSTLNKDNVWNSVLDNLDFWLHQSTWPQLPPISPILRPIDDDLTELIDLTKTDIKIEFNPQTTHRTVTANPNRHTFFNNNGCPCSRFDPDRCC